MNVKTAEQYLKRYRHRGAERAPKTRRSDVRRSTVIWPEDDFAYGSKPNHAARAVALPLRPFVPKRRPVQSVHPATAPLNAYQRVARYLAQNGSGGLTDRQSRRANHKERRANPKQASPSVPSGTVLAVDSGPPSGELSVSSPRAT